MTGSRTYLGNEEESRTGEGAYKCYVKFRSFNFFYLLVILRDYLLYTYRGYLVGNYLSASSRDIDIQYIHRYPVKKCRAFAKAGRRRTREERRDVYFHTWKSIQHYSVITY